MSMNLKSKIWFFIHNHRRNRLVARFARLCKNIHRASEHPGFDIENNGEKAVLKRTLSKDAPLLFDIGANVGDWTAMARSAFQRAVVHSFELNPVVATELGSRFSGDEGIHVHQYGLGAVSGEVDFFAYSDEASVLSSLRVPLHSHVDHKVKKAQVFTGDEVCSKHCIGHIDFLKIDAEGADFEVLLGFSEMLSEHRVSVIQFEHEAGRYLRDFYDFLLPKGYVVGKLYANYVDFQKHSAVMEHFLGPNYIAIPGSQRELIASLQKGW